jgi:hypothetical protein
MRRTITLLILALFTAHGHARAASQCVDTARTVTLQIHDYVHLPNQSLARASKIVTQLYGQIGVRTEWFPVLRQGGPRPKPNPTREPVHSPIAQVTIIVLTPQMAARGRIPEGTLGLAAVPDEGMGSIAYVIYDRVQRMAAVSATDEIQLAGLVMAHEVGHLLLGPNSQSDTGLMKGHWDRNDLRLFEAVTPRFSEPEAKRILARLEDVATAPRAVATTGGQDTPEACIGDLR